MTTDKTRKKAISKFKDIFPRTFTSLSLFAVLFLIVSLGQLPTVLFLILLQTLSFCELMNIYLASIQPNKHVPHALRWYFLAVALYYLYGKRALSFAHRTASSHAALQTLVQKHGTISHAFYIIGMLLFIARLARGSLKTQFRFFAYIHMSLFFVVFQSKCITENVMRGLFWFLFPVMLIVINDTAAYFFGRVFGRTRLIRVSPNKTLEGFVLGACATLVLSVFLSRYLAGCGFLTRSYEGIESMASYAGVGGGGGDFEYDMNDNVFGNVVDRKCECAGKNAECLKEKNAECLKEKNAECLKEKNAECFKGKNDEKSVKKDEKSEKNDDYAKKSDKKDENANKPNIASQEEISHIFKPAIYHLPHALRQLLHHAHINTTFITMYPIQIHGFILALLASFIAPFAGFFASALKRMFRIKDFASTLPGHGGILDRFDCHMLMGIITYIYTNTVLAERRVGLGQIVGLVEKNLTLEERRRLAVYLLSTAG